MGYRVQATVNFGILHEKLGNNMKQPPFQWGGCRNLLGAQLGMWVKYGQFSGLKLIDLFSLHHSLGHRKGFTLVTVFDTSIYRQLNINQLNGKLGRILLVLTV